MESLSNVSNARVTVPWTVVESSLWLRVGISGVGLAAWGVACLLAGEISIPAAVAALVTGGAIAVLSLRRGWRLLNKDVEPEVDSRPRTVRIAQPTKARIARTHGIPASQSVAQIAR